MNTPFELVPLFTTEKFNERPGLNEHNSFIITKLLDLPYLVNCRSYKVGYSYPSDKRKYPKVGFLGFFFGPYLIKFRKFPYRKNYFHMKLAELLK